MITRTKVVGILRKGDIMGIFWGRLKTYYNWSMWYFHSCLLKQFCWPFVFYVPMKNSWETFQLKYRFSSVQFSSLSRVWLFATPWIAARQASVSITNSWSSLRFTSIKSVMPSSHLILCCPLLLLPPIPPSIRVFSNESTLCMKWPKYWSFSFSIIPSKEIPGLIFRMGWFLYKWTHQIYYLTCF